MLLCLPALSQAQVAKQVEVSKDYKPTVSAAQKLSIIPDMTDTVMMRPDIDYSITPRSYETALMTQNFKPATITYWDYQRMRPLYVHAAVGMPLQSDADVYLSKYNKDKGYAMVYANHWGDYRPRYNVMGEKVKKNTVEMSNSVGARAGLFVGKRVFEVDIDGDMQMRHRYPLSGSAINFGRVGGKLRFGDDFTDLSRWNFNVEVGGGMFMNPIGDDDYNESNLSGKLAIGKMLGNHILRIHAEYDGIFGAKSLEQYKDHTLMAGARYGFSTERFDFLVGADYYYDAVSESTDNPHHIFPYLRMTWKSAKEGFVPFVEVDGGLKHNDYASLLYANPYVLPNASLSQLANEALYNGRIGISGRLGRGVFAYNLSAELSLANDHVYWYTFQQGNAVDCYHFTEAYQHSLRLDGGIMLRPAGWFETDLKAGVYVWENYGDYYANRPNFDASLGLRYLHRKFTVGVTAEYRGGIKWMTLQNATEGEELYAIANPEELKPTFGYTKTDATFLLGVKAEYRINDRWSVYAEGRNLTGSKVYEWLNYYRDTAEGIVGVKMSF